MALTNLLIFKQISIKSMDSPVSQGIYWKLIVIYSSIIILVNISYVFWIEWISLSLDEEKEFSPSEAFSWFPNWMI